MPTREDWDYQDFPPDLRCALLDSAITIEITDESNPEANTLSQILQDAKGVAWIGLTREAALDDWVCNASEMNGNTAVSSLGFEAKVVLLCTPTGGIQGLPDSGSLSRFMEKVPQMDPLRLAQAVLQRLQDSTSCWQIRSKTIVLLQTLLESKTWLSVYLPVLSSFAELMQRLETMRTTEHNPIPREQARKVLSLIQSNGKDNTLLMSKQTAVSPRAVRPPTKHEKRVSPMNKKKQPKPMSPVTTYSKRQGAVQPPPAIQTQSKTSKLSNNSQKIDDAAEIRPLTSPKIAKAAMASWRRRNSIETKIQANLLPMTEAMAKNPQFKNARAVWVSNSPRRGKGKRALIGTTHEPMQSCIQAAEPTTSRYNSGQFSSFAFMR